MKKVLLFLCVSLLFGCKSTVMNYPETKKGDVKDTLFGIVVEDPYRWLEDDNSEETKDWVKTQNELTFKYLNELPYRDTIKNRLTQLWDYPKSGAPFFRGGRWFMFKNNGLQNQSVLYTMDDPASESYLLLDPNELSNDGTVAFSDMDITADGKTLVYMIARSGSDWNEIYAMDIESKELLPDHIMWVKFSGLSCDGKGFYYSAYDQPKEGSELSSQNQGQKIYYHLLGTDQKSDKLIYSNPSNPSRMYTAGLTEDKNYLVITESESTSGNGLFIQNLKTPNAPIVKLYDGFDFEYYLLDVVDGKALILTNENSPKYQIVAADLAKPEKENWKIVVPEKENTLTGADLLGGKMFAYYMVDAKSRVEIYLPDGSYQGNLELPGICSLGSFTGTKDGSRAFYSISSYNTPGTIYEYNIETGKSTLFFKPEVAFDPDEIEVSQEFYASKDGTSVPMFIVHKKGLKKDGSNPTLLYAYGGFNISMTPSFSSANLFFIENGGIYVVANIRGGGEYGEEWHQAGTKMNKQNVFDDFISAAEYLISEGYTSSEKLAIRGGSNGGLLIGAVVNQRPDLFEVALPSVGVMDMLRYQKFTIGYAWASDYGTADDSKEMFEYLYEYSPYHSIRPGESYPAILAFTADHDDRVVPAHTFKYMSRMQEYNGGNLPVLVRIDSKAGHGSGKPTSKVIDEYTDLFAFTCYHLGMKVE